jgi:nucleotidyltransferase substrate binding protein (TIGR01987 family)
MEEDIRWEQRFANYAKALDSLRRGVALAGERELSELEKQGLIQGFEYTHELAWKVLKDYLEAQGFVGLIGSKNATREAFRNGLLPDGEAWMDMIKARNLTSHLYDVVLADAVANDILTRFFPAFEDLSRRLTALLEQDRDAS